MVPAVNIEGFAGNQLREVSREERDRLTDIVNRNQASLRRLGLGLADEFIELVDSRCGPCFDWAGRYRMNAYPFGAELSGQIAH